MGGSGLCATFNLTAGQLKHLTYGGLPLTRVRRDVFPEPVGPIKSMDGNVVRPLLRKTTEWRKMGIVMARRIAIANPRGDGFRRACTKSCTAAMIFWMADVLLVELSPKLGSVGVVLCNTVGKASDQVRIACTFVPTNPLLHNCFLLGAQPRSLRKCRGPARHHL